MSLPVRYYSYKSTPRFACYTAMKTHYVFRENHFSNALQGPLLCVNSYKETTVVLHRNSFHDCTVSNKNCTAFDIKAAWLFLDSVTAQKMSGYTRICNNAFSTNGIEASNYAIFYISQKDNSSVADVAKFEAPNITASGFNLSHFYTTNGVGGLVTYPTRSDGKRETCHAKASFVIQKHMECTFIVGAFWSYPKSRLFYDQEVAYDHFYFENVTASNAFYTVLDDEVGKTRKLTLDHIYFKKSTISIIVPESSSRLTLLITHAFSDKKMWGNDIRGGTSVTVSADLTIPSIIPLSLSPAFLTPDLEKVIFVGNCKTAFLRSMMISMCEPISPWYPLIEPIV